MARRRPSDYRPPVRVGEFVQAPEAEEDERIDVGVCFVGGGPAGLAGAMRLAQLLEADPATAEKLGETPIAVLDKGRVVGAHLLSGAVVNPSALRDLLPGEELGALPGCYGEVRKRVRLLHAQGLRGAHPHAAALPQQGQPRLLAERSWAGTWPSGRGDGRDGAARDRRAEAAGARPARCVGVRTGDKGLDREGQPLGSFEPGVEVHAQATVLCRGHAGPPGRRAVRALRLQRRHPAGVRASASRRSGGSTIRSTASSTRWAGRSGWAASGRSWAAASSTRWARTC